MMKIEKVTELERDLKKLKKLRTIEDDLELFLQSLHVDPIGYPPATVPISRLGSSVIVPVFKRKHFRCKQLKGKGSRSGIRVIYAYEKGKNKITVLEIYFKSHKPNHDENRILKYFGTTESGKE